jgi:hypothetical protein
MLCPRCGSEIPASDVNLDSHVARCARCSEVFRLAGQGPARPARPPAAAKRAPRPQGLTVVDDGDRRQIVRRWSTRSILPGLCFCAIWDGFVVAWYTMAFATASRGGESARGAVCMVLITLPHLALGVGLTYMAQCSLVKNTTVAEVAGGRLRVRHGPLPWPGNHDLDAAEVRQLYCTEKAADQGRSREPCYDYTVHAVLADHRTVPLLDDLDDKTTALFYEQQLEEWLGIKPEHVPGEVDS